MTLTSLPLPIQKRIIQLLSNNNFVEAKAVRDAWLMEQSQSHSHPPLHIENIKEKNTISELVDV